MEFPTIVYRCPGVHQRAGGTYAYQAVQDGRALEQAKAAGWYSTLVEAIEAHDKPKTPEQKVEATAPTGRQALEQEAEKLGLKVDRRWSDKRLAEEVAAQKG